MKNSREIATITKKKKIQNTEAKNNLSLLSMSSGQCLSNASKTQAAAVCCPLGKSSLPLRKYQRQPQHHTPT